MQLLEAIETRRTIKDFKPDSVPDDVLETCLEAGLWAQNHRLTQPWLFRILGEKTKAVLVPQFPKLGEKPCVVVVSCLKSDGGEQEREDYAAVACAIQNIALRAHEFGLGLQWSSGKAATGAHLHEPLGINAEREFLVGMLFFGVPREVPAPKPRRPLSEVLERLP